MSSSRNKRGVAWHIHVHSICCSDSQQILKSKRSIKNQNLSTSASKTVSCNLMDLSSFILSLSIYNFNFSWYPRGYDCSFRLIQLKNSKKAATYQEILGVHLPILKKRNSPVATSKQEGLAFAPECPPDRLGVEKLLAGHAPETCLKLIQRSSAWKTGGKWSQVPEVLLFFVGASPRRLLDTIEHLTKKWCFLTDMWNDESLAWTVGDLMKHNDSPSLTGVRTRTSAALGAENRKIPGLQIGFEGQTSNLGWPQKWWFRVESMEGVLACLAYYPLF